MAHSSTFALRIQARRRLEILLLLAQSPRFGASESTLVEGVADRGVAASRNALLEDIAWLAVKGLVTLRPDDRVVIATQQGLDVANGLEIVPGIARPNPEDLQ